MKTVITQAIARRFHAFDFHSHIIVVKVFFFALWITLSLNVHADTKDLQNCWASQKELVTIGLPKRHHGLLDSGKTIVMDKVCPAFVLGNDYEILDWLENGKIDAAVISPFAAALLLRSTIPQSSASASRIENTTLSKLWGFIKSLFHVQAPPASEIPSEKMPKYFGMSTLEPLTHTSLPSYHVKMQVFGSEGTYQETYDDLIKEISQKDNLSQNIFVESYLSIDFPLLLSYTEHRFKELNLGELDSTKNKEFWVSFLERIKFRNGGSMPSLKTGDVIVEQLPVTTPFKSPNGNQLLGLSTPTQDIFVYRQRLQKKLLASDDFNNDDKFGWLSPTIPYWLKNKEPSGTQFDESLFYIINSTYAVREEGFRKHRHFRFKLDELWSFLDRNQDDNDNQFALILTGGGVKSAYQTSLIDHLYGEGYLTNTAERYSALSEKPTKPIKVDHLIGTSGGALLGGFVKDINGSIKPESLKLTDKIWTKVQSKMHINVTDTFPYFYLTEKKHQSYINNFDVFPFLEMPRYLSLIWGMLIFSIFSILLEYVKNIPWIKNTTKPTTLSVKHQIQKPLDTHFSSQFLWVTLLICTPWVIKLVNGTDGLEHVPAVAGIFYFIYMLIAIWSDNRLVFRQSFKWKTIDFKGNNLIMLVTGIILASVLFTMSIIPDTKLVMEKFPSWQYGVFGVINLGTVICCLGILMIFIATHNSLASSSNGARNTRLINGYSITKGFCVMLLVPAIATMMLRLTGKSLFELSEEFWWNFSIWSVFSTALLLFVAHLPWKNPVSCFIRDGLDFLNADSLNTTFILGLKRYQRITIFAVLAFFYWNIVMAPAIYGNGRANEYFKKTYMKIVFDCTEKDNCTDFLKQSLSNPYPPKTNFVVSATSLVEKKERYFLFHPDMLNTSSDNENPLIKAGLDTDPRWISADNNVTHQEFLDVLFASGSPFPIFPATKAGLSSKGKEWLVDGGYAHNVPIEAASALGAQRVLVISSSPLHQHEETEDQSTFEELWDWGSLILNAHRLFPYFFERSQVEDKMSAEEMLVATISPVHREEKWPKLTDFKSEVIVQLLKWAKEDKNKRIGMVESWGTPVCEFGSIRYTCQELKKIKIFQYAN